MWLLLNLDIGALVAAGRYDALRWDTLISVGLGGLIGWVIVIARKRRAAKDSQRDLLSDDAETRPDANDHTHPS